MSRGGPQEWLEATQITLPCRLRASRVGEESALGEILAERRRTITKGMSPEDAVRRLGFPELLEGPEAS